MSIADEVPQDVQDEFERDLEEFIGTWTEGVKQHVRSLEGQGNEQTKKEQTGASGE